MPRSDAWVYARPLRNWRRIIRHRRQRASRGFSTYDAWNLDGYLAQVIADGMAHLMKHSHGYPGSFSCEEEWKSALARIEVPLRVWAECKFDMMDLDEERRWEERCHEALSLLNEVFFGLWD